MKFSQFLMLGFLSSVLWPSLVLADANDDWLARSTAPAVTMSTRFDVETDVTEHLAGNTQDRVSWTTDLKITGNGALRFDLLSTDTTGHGDWRRFFYEGDTVGDFHELQPGDEIYLQFRQYTPEYLATHDWRQVSGGATGFKQSIMSSYHNSNTAFEVVLTSTSRGYPSAYHQDGNGYPGLGIAWNTACNNNDVRHQNAIDWGPNPLTGLSPDNDAWTACEQDRARYGGLYSYSANLGFPRGEPDPLTGAVIYPHDGWITYLQRVKLNSGYDALADNEVQIWAARDGEDYIKIVERFNVKFGGKNTSSTNVVEGFTSFWLLPYTSGGAASGAGPAGYTRENTFTVYDEVIVSTESIPAPSFAVGDGNPAPTVSLTASPTTITEGASSTLTWTVTNATSCSASDAWSGAKLATGSSEMVMPLVTSTYTLSCTGIGGTRSDSVTVTVNPLVTDPPTVSLTATPNPIDQGNASVISWVTTNATSCSASGAWSGGKDSKGGSESVSPSATSTYTLTCMGDGGSDDDSVTVTVNGAGPMAPTVSLTASRLTIDEGMTSLLTWVVTNADSCTAFGAGAWSGSKTPTGGNEVVLPTVTSTYVLTCTGVGGSTSDTATIVVNAVDDTDADGLPDSWELTYFGDLSQGADDDADNDGVTNINEYLNDTDPNVANTVAESSGGGSPAPISLLMLIGLWWRRRS
ncbi:MAG: hypothetical protein HKM24_07260 [Gammaproteobacteria bacterium]|nr:hypothetical protein [Gammaproteobacteria bacterium]